MIRVTGCVDVRALGRYDFEFFVPDGTSREEIEKEVDRTMSIYTDYQIEEGYEEYTGVKYRKKED